MPPASALFTPATRAWLERRFAAPTPVQSRGWPILAAGRHALLIAPTGSGKTLAAFLAAIDRLGRRPADAKPGVRVLYVSPLKALVADIERNLRVPLAGIAAEAARRAEADREARVDVEDGENAARDVASFRAPRVAIRTGDSTPRERRLLVRDPAEILVTTPESLYLMLGSQARETLASVETIIVDEIHALAGSKRGVHLALSLERVARRCRGGDPQRIGLSATARPAAEIARFLGGDRAVEIVDASAPPAIDLLVRVPVPDMTRLDPVRADSSAAAATPAALAAADAAGGVDPAAPAAVAPSLWSAIHPVLLEQIRAHASSIVFTNSRALCERLAQALNDLAGEPLVRAHHGSVAPDERREIEAALAGGRLRGIVATSSLELGIDMAAVELVLLVESPGAVARGLQRIGRAGHAVGETSRGLLFPKHRADLLEAAVVARGMRAGEVEAIHVPRGALDVLAQQIVAIVAEGPTTVDALAALIRRTLCYAELDSSLLGAVLDMLSGKYPSAEFAELRPRLRFDRANGRLEIREGAGRIALLSGGTIPDRGQYAVHVADGGPRIGELDEEMVHETRTGDVVVLGASSWRVVEIGRDRVLVVPAPGEPGRLPFWRGDGPGRPIELGRALGRYVRTLSEQADPAAWLRAEGQLDEYAIGNLVAHLSAQTASTGRLPHDRQIVIERFRDELGDHRIAIHSPFGARVHAPWAIAIAERFAAHGGGEVHPLWTDDGILLRFLDTDRPPATASFLPDAESVEELVSSGLEDSALFAAEFRENAARALLLPRRHARARTPLWSQRLRAQNLHGIARGFPDFPIMLETYRSCLQDVFDLPSLVALLRGIEAGEVAVCDVETASPSPFARSLVFAYTASFLYQSDLPAAERRSQALALDRTMLRELLGSTDLRKFLDAAAIDAVEASLQKREPEQRVAHADGLHDRLRELGDLTDDELAARHGGGGSGDCSSGAADPGFAADLATLVEQGRALRVEVGGQSRWIAVEDAALYRDALGVALPKTVSTAFLAPAHAPLEQLLLRHARSHGPFTTAALASRFGLAAESLAPLLASLARRGRLLAGEFDPRRTEGEWCEPEVLRRIKKRTLARLREEIAPVEGEVFARFLLDWHGITKPQPGSARLEAVLDQLEGLALPFAELEGRILPLRLPDYRPEQLDALGSEGRLVWLGEGAIGEGEGRVALIRRERLAVFGARSLADLEDEFRGEPDGLSVGPGPSALARRIAVALEARGASFFSELVQAFPDVSTRALEEALFELAGEGLVTNDTFAPLRAGAAGRRARAGRGSRSLRPRRPGRHAPPAATSGRWSLVVPRPLVAPERHVAPAQDSPSSPTALLHARTLALLDRHGIVSRESLEIEREPGGFTALYPVLRELEEAGRVRRGHFSSGTTSAQFALPGAVDRLRAARAMPDEGRAVLLASLDPAQPYGAMLPWPERFVGRPRRAVGTSVVLVDGRAVLFVERGGRQVLCFEDAEREAGEARLLSALQRLVGSVAKLGIRRLAVDSIDGEPAHRSPRAELFRRAGFRESARGFEADRLGSSR
ncbi:MAG: DEAD/DEAH box helicase [Deltaproteobacteria bacterium]|nr:DEAD/DEAH box helicase [Deltaproteobacteria bacterium]